MNNSWKIQPQEVLEQSPVMPVLVVQDVEHALPLADALIEGGITVLEVTLRSECALAVIERIASERPNAYIGAGTVTNKQQLRDVSNAGAKFAISPGVTDELLHAGQAGSIPLIPGVANTSNIMTANDAGYDHLKFFPAAVAGGVKALKAIAGPFPDVVFCPTGGIDLSNYKEYLALSNVKCVGGSWLASPEAIQNQQWEHVTAQAKQALAL